MLENPTLLFEILSPSTERIDRKRKRELYLQIPTLSGYFLVSQDKPLIETHTRSSDDWQYREYSGLDATLVIPTPECEIPPEVEILPAGELLRRLVLFTITRTALQFINCKSPLKRA